MGIRAIVCYKTTTTCYIRQIEPVSGYYNQLQLDQLDFKYSFWVYMLKPARYAYLNYFLPD